MRDSDIRAALKRELFSQYKTDRNTVVIEELGVHHGTSRIDLAVVNGVLHGYELKSEKDTLTRLSAQVVAYSAVFDLITLVVAERHVRRAAEIAPDWWGIKMARTKCGRLYFRDLKLPLRNPTADPISVAALLWRDEALAFLEELGAAKGVRSKSRSHIYLKLVKHIGLDDLRDKVRERLKDRRDWRSAGIRQLGDD
jgi:phage gp46-like protein